MASKQEDNRITIIRAHRRNPNYTYAELAKSIKLPKSTIARVVKVFRDRCSTARKPGSGGNRMPQAATTTEVVTIGSKQNPNLSARDVANKPEVQSTAVYRAEKPAELSTYMKEIQPSEQRSEEAKHSPPFTQMEEQTTCFEELQTLHLNDSIRQISQEPERIEDEVFVRICRSCDNIRIEQLSSVLQPLLEKLLPTAGCDGKRTHVQMAEKGSTLKEIISEVLARIDEFCSLEQYIWLVKFSCCLCLLKDLPIGMSFEINKVIRSVAGLDTEEYEFDPVMIHTITKSLLEEIPLDGMNLVHVVKKLTALNQKLLYYVSISLLFAGLRHHSNPDEPIAMYRLYGFGDVLTKLEALKICSIKQTLNLRRLFLILKLLSCYQNAVLLRHSGCSWEDVQEQHRCFADCFRFTMDQKKMFTQWLCMARNLVTSLNCKSGMQEIELKEDFLLVIELIDLDMIALMEDDIDEAKE